jgi:hypothetical protein
LTEANPAAVRLTVPLSLSQVIPGTTTDVVAYCSKADLTSDVDPAGNARPALLRVCSAGHGNGQVVESRDELTTGLAATPNGKSFFSGTVTLDTVRQGVFSVCRAAGKDRGREGDSGVPCAVVSYGHLIPERRAEVPGCTHM